MLAETGVHGNALDFDDARQFAIKQRAGDGPGLCFGGDRQLDKPLVGAALLAAHFGNAYAALTGNRRGADHVHRIKQR